MDSRVAEIFFCQGQDDGRSMRARDPGREPVAGPARRRESPSRRAVTRGGPHSDGRGAQPGVLSG